MSAQFSSNEATSLEKQIDNLVEVIDTSPERLDFVYEIQRCIKWIKENEFKKVCLQFPDHLLSDSSEVALCLQEAVKEVVYIMGDTAYESCCVDYVAAAHVDADAIIHYGPVCFSKASENIPCSYVYEKLSLDVDVFKDALIAISLKDLSVIVDTPYIVHIDDLNTLNVTVHSITQENLEVSNKRVLFIGNLQRKLTNFYNCFKPRELFYYDPSTLPPKIVNYQQDLKILKRRYFLIEKIKDSNTIGIVIGTVAVKNYLKVIDRIKRLIKLNKKKYYVISVGKPTVAKLANFPEIDIFVVISCAMNEIYDSRDYYKPIVTPFDIESALNPSATDIQFSYDYNSYLPDKDLSENELEQLKKLQLNDVSLLTGKIRSNDVPEEQPNDKRLALKSDGTISVNTFGAGFLADKSWKGLEQNLGCDKPEIATEGRSGLAQSYTHEK